jgi:phosphoglycerate dehydrogenase-like enzyme
MRIAILDDYQNVALATADWSRLAGPEEFAVANHHLTGDALVSFLAGAEVIVAMRERTPFDAALLGRLPALRLLVTTGMRNPSIDLDAARSRGITVCGTAGSGPAAAELAFGLIIALTRHIPTEAARLRRGETPWQSTLGSELRGKTLGILGFGRLGTRMARYASAFEMDILAHSRSLTPEKAAEHGATATGLSDMLERADILSIHLTLTPETRGIIGSAELARMMPGALLVNTARGPIVDETALIAALESGHLGGAALDVYDTEPLSVDHPFRRLPSVIALPHLGYVTAETYRTFYQGAVDDIQAWKDGSPMRVLNP